MARQVAHIVTIDTILTRRIARKTILSFGEESSTCAPWERGTTPTRPLDAPLTARSSEVHGENQVDLHAPIGLSMVWLQRPTDDRTCRHTIACPPEEGQTGDGQC